MSKQLELQARLTRRAMRDAFGVDVFYGPVARKAAHPFMELVNPADLGFIPNVAGGAKGISSDSDLVTQTTDGRDLNELWATLQQVAAVQNAERDALVNLLTYSVTDPTEEVPQGDSDEFEEASEFGVPQSVRPSLNYFQMAYTFKWYDLAGRYTWQYLADADVRQINQVANSALNADNRLVFKQVMKTLFNNTNLTANIKKQPYTVYKFYNNDGTVPPSYKSNVFDGTHNHYMASNGALAPADIEGMQLQLTHHGYSRTNGYQLVLLTNPVENAGIRTWKAGTTYNGSVATYDFIPAVGQPGILLPSPVVGVGVNQPANKYQGLDVVGSYGDWLIVSDDYVPPGFLAGFATGGPDRLTNPIGFREHANASLRGLKLIKGRNADYPLIDSYWGRGFGTGIRQRGAGVVMKITAGPSGDVYAPPAEYV
jgi:hypothetical protein